MIENFNTLNKDYGPIELKEKGSKFIAYSYPVSNTEDADNIIRDLRKKFHDATHVCFAYRIGDGEEKFIRFNDDGEPAGTAGKPIYQEIIRRSLFNTLVAVVRYFGGVKLGKGGLQRAYSSSARDVLDISDTITIELKKEISLSIPFNFIGDVINLISPMGIKIISQDYSAEGVSMLLSVPVGKVENFRKTLIEKSTGKISF
ncbi:MAG TPA: YigZ family protein [Candidatus Eremiobacteraeota bacterium]|nr:MAG: IMPACT family member YigZ [bacterium ADurb.Bin363]HPZ07399.1 YigZ family protein [Candidatus Eremiobacteraeota bacterium]